MRNKMLCGVTTQVTSKYQKQATKTFHSVFDRAVTLENLQNIMFAFFLRFSFLFSSSTTIYNSISVMLWTVVRFTLLFFLLRSHYYGTIIHIHKLNLILSLTFSYNSEHKWFDLQWNKAFLGRFFLFVWFDFVRLQRNDADCSTRKMSWQAGKMSHHHRQDEVSFTFA